LVIEKSPEYDTDFVIGNIKGDIYYFRLVENQSNWELIKLYHIALENKSKYT